MRKFLKQLHKWLSIPVGIIITIICLTGAILAFQQEIQEIAHPSRYFVNEVQDSVIPLDQLLPLVNAQVDTSIVTNVEISPDLNRTYRMSLSKGFRTSVFVNPYTGEITGKYEYQKSPFFTIMTLHRWLMDGSRTWGKYTIGISTIIFIFILISGFIVWMPRRMNKSRFKIQFRKGKKRLLYDLHNVLGVYACLVLLVCALTGLMWSFECYRNGVFKLFGAEATTEKKRGDRKKDDKKEIDYANWQKVFDNVKSSNPDYEFISIEDGSLGIHQKSSNTSTSKDKYSFDKNSGDVTQITLFKDQDTKTKVWAWTYALHVGNYWGIWSKIFTCIFALIGASLPITGYYIFFAKRNKKK